MFGDQKKKQSDGGPIGLVITDAVAKIYMTWWDRQLKKKATENGMEIALYKRYVDDITIVARERAGSSTDENEVDGTPRDEEGMMKIKDMGNSIHNSIQLEVEYPSKQHEKKMPVLDVKVWLQEVQDQGRLCIMYEFYSKEVASKALIGARSAVPWRDKRNIMTQEVLRILKNCSVNLPWQNKVSHIENLCMRMQFSGYDVKFRREVVDSGIKAYKTMQRNDENNTIPLHRPRKWKQLERARNKRKKRVSWYCKGGKESVIFIPATPQGRLKRRMTEVINKSGVKIGIVEHTKTTVKKLFQKASIEKTACADGDCKVCASDKKYQCRKESAVYEITCTGCKGRYIGETSRTTYSRASEHMADYEAKRESSVLWRHCRERHGGQEQTFQISVRKVFHRDPTLRQITESLDIRWEAPIMNSKSEWNCLHLPQLQVQVSDEH